MAFAAAVEKRKFRRARLITQVKCETLGRQGLMLTRDISVGGMFVNDRDPYPADCVVGLAFRLSPTEPLLTCKGKVVYSIRGVGMGIMFTDLGDDVRAMLEKFVDEAS